MINTTNMIKGKQRFSDEANTHYRYSNADSLVDNLYDLTKMIIHHQTQQRPRLETLREYYKGNNETILTENRRLDSKKDLADHRATHNFSKYVSQFIQGYMVGIPIKTSYPDDKVDEQIKELNRNNDADEHNSDLVLDQSIYGRAYELVYRNQQDQVKFTALSVMETFVIYDDTVEFNPIAAVRYISKQFEEETIVHLYTDGKERIYSFDSSRNLKLKVEEDRYYGGIPVIEYENNKYRQGDFEDVLTLIDLYDSAQSDTANYMQDLNDAMLKIKGNVDLDADEAKKQKDANIIMLVPEQSTEGRYSDVDAEYIYKEYDVNGTEAYKDRVFNNILLFTSIPNLLDDKQSTSGQSGEAIKMKLFALSQIRSTKERLFKKSLRDRYRIVDNILRVASEGSFDVNEISTTFTENLPSMIAKDMEWFSKAGGELSNQTMLENLPFIENAQEEMERIEEENEMGDSYPELAEMSESNGEG